MLFGLVAFGLFVYLVSDGSLLASLLFTGVGFLGINQRFSKLSLHNDNLIASTTFYTFTVNYKDVLSFGHSFYPANAVYIVVRVLNFIPFLIVTGQIMSEESNITRADFLSLLKERSGRSKKA